MNAAILHRVLSRWSVAVFAIAFGLNFVWEMAQASLYVSMGSAWEATRRCLVASIGDGAMVLAVLVATLGLAGRASVERQYVVSVALALAVAVAVEWWGPARTAGRTWRRCREFPERHSASCHSCSWPP